MVEGRDIVIYSTNGRIQQPVRTVGVPDDLHRCHLGLCFPAAMSKVTP